MDKAYAHGYVYLDILSYRNDNYDNKSCKFYRTFHNENITVKDYYFSAVVSDFILGSKPKSSKIYVVSSSFCYFEAKAMFLRFEQSYSACNSMFNSTHTSQDYNINKYFVVRSYY